MRVLHMAVHFAVCSEGFAANLAEHPAGLDAADGFLHRGGGAWFMLGFNFFSASRSTFTHALHLDIWAGEGLLKAMCLSRANCNLSREEKAS
jgi:hypothetical protein